MNPLTILMYLPVCLSAAVAVENVYASEPGATKLKIITDSVQAVLTAAGKSLDPKVLAIIVAVTNGVVGVLNTLGLFSKSTTTVTAAPGTTTAPKA